ncbi:hypothetical protein BDW59DRAFT_162953 [Aspergillus cavernicola]|uniref:Monooxygenase n=1 Tax=Aspergillus cavernicola TaxID=176166 RepID=A0ABR4I7R8_9EURO
MAPETPNPIPSYSQIACVGAGISAIALGATLRRWHQIDDIRFFERHDDCGGTWHISSYPGCACDVPSALYSFSFAPNPRWTKLMPSNKEIKAYQQDVADTYGLREKMKRRKQIEAYMRKTAPEKYHDILIPDFEVGCKRRVFDCGYLDSLHKENTLLTDAKILEIVPEGIKTSNGLIPADVIVLATGFDTSYVLPGITVHGRNNTTVAEH